MGFCAAKSQQHSQRAFRQAMEADCTRRMWAALIRPEPAPTAPGMTRVISDYRFRKMATESVRRSSAKWLSCAAKGQSDITLGAAPEERHGPFAAWVARLVREAEPVLEFHGAPAAGARSRSNCDIAIDSHLLAVKIWMRDADVENPDACAQPTGGAVARGPQATCSSAWRRCDCSSACSGWG
jgi:hypothetical protein